MAYAAENFAFINDRVSVLTQKGIDRLKELGFKQDTIVIEVSLSFATIFSLTLF